MSATVITLSEFHATAAEQANQVVRRRPVSVLVHWSESGVWAKEQVVPFAEFEQQAGGAALAHAAGGYHKTSITVRFDDGEEYPCRIDLAAHDELGFADHCLAILAHSATDKGGDELITFIQGIDFGPDAVARNAELRAAGQVAVQAAEEARRAEIHRNACARQQARQEAERLADEWRAALVIPDNAKAVIVARRVSMDAERSDPYADYYCTQNDEVVILAWSTHTRDLFSEMRKAAKHYPATACLADPEQSDEHREKYSMGAGYYLTGKRFIREGWIIQKQRFWNEANKALHIPHGVIAIPGYVGLQAEPIADVAEVVPAAQVESAPASIKPRFTAQRVGGGWSVTIQQGEQRRQFDGIEAVSLAEACRIAWTMFSESTPPDDDPSGLPLPAAPMAEQDDQFEQGAQAPTRAERLGNYAQRVEAKRERLEVRAIQASQASDHHWVASRAVIGELPFGQPILVGHHSERRHRRAIDQSHSQMRQCVAQSEQAERLSRRAQSVGHGGIASDDPEAVDKLREVLAKREQKQQAMKEANEAQRGTYRAWQLGNNNAEIHRLRQRIATLQQLHQAAPIELAGAGWRMSEEEGRVLVVFDGKPADDIRQLCKRAGFVWSPRRAAWVRKVTVQAVRAAKRLAGMLPEALAR